MILDIVNKVRKRRGAEELLSKFNNLTPTEEQKAKEIDWKHLVLSAKKVRGLEPTSPVSDVQPPKKLRIDDDAYNLKKLTGNKLRALTLQAEHHVKETEKIYAAVATDNRPNRKIKIWEAFAGNGRLTQILTDKYPGVKAERFSLEEGWDFSKAIAPKVLHQQGAD